MEIELTFFIDILKILPLNSICYIQAPSLTSTILLEHLEFAKVPYYRCFQLNVFNKKLFTDCITNENIQEDIQSIEIRLDDLLLLEGYDGLEYFTISKTLKLPDCLYEKYLYEDVFNISMDW
jgi:hypothetical protein